MKMLFPVLFLLLLITCITTKDSLQPGEIREASVGRGETQRYEFNLDYNDFLALVVQQKGVDLVVRLKDPDGKKIRDYDSPNGKWGEEFISYISKAGGIYTVEISPLNENEPGGNYSVEFLKKEPAGATPEKQVDQLFTFWDRPGSPGAAVSVAHEDRILYSRGYGYANLEYDIPVSSSTIFHIASVSKQVTAFSIALLADQGELSLDDDIHKYLPELNDFGETITIRHLLHHTSGLRDQWNLLALAGWRLDDVITRDQILRLVSHQKELNFKPGDEMVYCNTGYTLMAEIVSRVSGISFAEWTRENIFDPLEMNSTLFYDDHEKIVPNRAYSYNHGRSGFKKSVLSYANVGATSLFTTVDDFQRWADNFRTMKVGNENVMKMMESRGILNNGDTLSYAFGQVAGNYRGLKTWSHGGGDAGYRTFLLRFPDQHYSICVFSNYGSFDPADLGYKTAGIYLKDYINDDDMGQEMTEETDTVEKVQVPVSLLEEYAGRYVLMEQIILDFRLDDGQFFVQAPGQSKSAVEARSDTLFYVPDGKATIIFRRSTEGVVNGFRFLQGGGELIARRMPKPDPKAIRLDDYTGRYYSEELQTAYDLRIEKDTLAAFHQRHDPVKLTYIDEGKFAGNAWFFGTIEFTRRPSGSIDGCLVSSGRVRNVRFLKTGE